ncbi:hypothetical protein RGE_18050 [Rubrivivax gelatinosus IL144]|uniref:Uncharacterized protein n=1 Tax=Rubrivivax gelatinosus (strain NBRC 100245 / IL144) TaxID=983917 RepID=I0HQ59_RUBGI|nr:hypothetical protein RGE_18050 [Rubrivivax gelatinosus IL144]
MDSTGREGSLPGKSSHLNEASPCLASIHVNILVNLMPKE